MTARKSDPPPKIVEQITDGSLLVRERATELSRRIVSFQQWLNALPGKVPCEFWHTVEEDSRTGPGVDLGISFQRYGKEWVIRYKYFYYADRDENEQERWEHLTEANLETKLTAVSLFPQFLEKLAASQRERLAEIDSACAAFDTFANEISLKTTEGQNEKA